MIDPMITRYLNDLASLFFPDTCAGCDTPLVYGERLICTSCWYQLPVTLSADKLHMLGTGPSASLFLLTEPSRIQRIIHRMKYRNRPEIGILLGERFGSILADTPPYAESEVVVPVPLHPLKLRQRGYNQSACFAQGLATAMGKPVAIHGLARLRATESQTTKNRYERYTNMESAFRLNEPAAIIGKHVLLVDDVLTTGATLEACAAVLLEGGATKVSAATIAKTL